MFQLNEDWTFNQSSPIQRTNRIVVLLCGVDKNKIRNTSIEYSIADGGEQIEREKRKGGELRERENEFL